MNRLILLWNTVFFARNEPLYAIRILGALTLATILSTQIAQSMHHPELADVFVGMSVAASGLLMIQAFALSSAEYKCDPLASETIQRHLSRKSL